MKRAVRILLPAIALAGIGVGVGSGLRGSDGPPSSAAAPSPRAALPTVAVAAIARRDLAQEVEMVAEFRPYQEVDLGAKVTGYLREIRVDFGDRVKAGDVLATIEVPELQSQLDAAGAAVQRAEAAAEDARLEYSRLAKVDQAQPDLVAQQDIDNARTRDLAAQAAVAAARADAEKFRTLMGYTRITAPFDGVVTRRYVDPGALISADGSGHAPAILRLSENQRLRLDFSVAVAYADAIRAGTGVSVRIAGSPDPIPARVTRYTREVDADTRTMQTEVEIPNPDLRLLPGSYATVVLAVDPRAGAVAIPVQAVGSPANPTAWVVGEDGMLQTRPLTLGIETPRYYEVLSGLEPGERVVLGDRSALSPGERVAPRLVQAEIR